MHKLKEAEENVILMILIVKPVSLTNIILYLVGIDSLADQQGSPFFNFQYSIYLTKIKINLTIGWCHLFLFLIQIHVHL